MSNERTGLQGERNFEGQFSLAASSPIPKNSGTKILPKSSHKKKRGTVIGNGGTSAQRTVGVPENYTNNQSIKMKINTHFNGV